MNTLKIVFSGKMQAGKDTAAEYLTKVLRAKGYNPKYLGITDELKKLCLRAYGRNDREILQVFGVNIVRDGCLKYLGDADFWVNCFLWEVHYLASEFDVILCADLRFPNELKALKDDGFNIVRLNVTEEQQRDRAKESGCDISGLTHQSEVALDDKSYASMFDFIIPPIDVIGLKQQLHVFIDKVLGI